MGAAAAAEQPPRRPLTQGQPARLQPGQLLRLPTPPQEGAFLVANTAPAPAATGPTIRPATAPGPTRASPQSGLAAGGIGDHPPPVPAIGPLLARAARLRRGAAAPPSAPAADALCCSTSTPTTRLQLGIVIPGILSYAVTILLFVPLLTLSCPRFRGHGGG